MKSLHKALSIIEAVAMDKSTGIRELSAKTGYAPTTVHRIVSTLVDRRYLVKDPVTKKYSLSLKFLELGTKVQQQFNLTAIARPHLERLMADTRESVNLAVREGDEIVYLDHVRSDYSMLQLFTQIGARVPLYATGVGKLFLSRLSESEFDKYLQRTILTPLTQHTFTDRDAILKEIALSHSLGFAVDNEEFEAGVRCVASLIFDHSGEAIAAVSISGAVVRITPDRIEHFGEQVKHCAHDISLELGFDLTKNSTLNNRKEDNHV